MVWTDGLCLRACVRAVSAAEKRGTPETAPCYCQCEWIITNNHDRAASPVRDRFHRRLFHRIVPRSTREPQPFAPDRTEAIAELFCLYLFFFSSGCLCW